MLQTYPHSQHQLSGQRLWLMGDSVPQKKAEASPTCYLQKAKGKQRTADQRLVRRITRTFSSSSFLFWEKFQLPILLFFSCCLTTASALFLLRYLHVSIPPKPLTSCLTTASHSTAQKLLALPQKLHALCLIFVPTSSKQHSSSSSLTYNQVPLTSLDLLPQN